MLLGAALRFATIGVQSFSDDEQFTVWLVSMPFGDMFTTVPSSEATPHLYYVLAWFCAQALGTGEAGMRILPAVLGTLTVPVVYRAGAVAASRRVGLAAAAFVAVNPFLIWYSQEARAYSLAIFLTAVALACLLSFRRDGGAAPLAGWAVAAAAALATHYYVVFVLLPQAAWLLWSDRSDLRRRLAAVSVPAIAGLLLLPLALHQRGEVSDPGGVGSRGIAERLVAVPKNFLVGYSIPLEVLVTIVAGALGAVALLLAIRADRPSERRLAALAGALAGVPIVLALGLAPVGFDYLTSRSLVMALVPAALVLGCGFGQGRKGAVALAGYGALSLAVVIGIAADGRYQRRDWRGLAQALGPPRVDRVLVFTPAIANAGPFGVYYGPGRVTLGGYAHAQEIAVVALAGYGGFAPGPGKPPSGPAPRPPAGFRMRQDITTSTYRLVRFTAPRRHRLEVQDLIPLAFPDEQAVAVEQQGQGARGR